MNTNTTHNFSDSSINFDNDHQIDLIFDLLDTPMSFEDVCLTREKEQNIGQNQIIKDSGNSLSVVLSSNSNNIGVNKINHHDNYHHHNDNDYNHDSDNNDNHDNNNVEEQKQLEKEREEYDKVYLHLKEVAGGIPPERKQIFGKFNTQDNLMAHRPFSMWNYGHCPLFDIYKTLKDKFRNILWINPIPRPEVESEHICRELTIEKLKDILTRQKYLSEEFRPDSKEKEKDEVKVNIDYLLIISNTFLPQNVGALLKQLLQHVRTYHISIIMETQHILSPQMRSLFDYISSVKNAGYKKELFGLKALIEYDFQPHDNSQMIIKDVKNDKMYEYHF